jgi:hypothetical protein
LIPGNEAAIWGFSYPFKIWDIERIPRFNDIGVYEFIPFAWHCEISSLDPAMGIFGLVWPLHVLIVVDL